MKNFNIKKMRSSQLPFYRKCIFQLDTKFAKFGVNELETIFCFKKSMFTNNKIQHTGILNQLNFQPNKMLSTIFVDVHPKLHMFIKLWSNISVLYNSRSLSNNNNALTNSIPTNIFHRTNLWVVNSHSFIWNVQQKIRNILRMICYIFFSIPSKLQYIH